jgi:hypothetical protein
MTLTRPNLRLGTRLAALRRALLWRGIFANALWALGVLTALSLLLACLDWRFVLSEGQAALALCLAAAAALLALIFGHLRALLRAPSAYQLALIVEKERPELMDAFVCAVGLEKLERPLRSIEQDLLADMQGRFLADEPFWHEFRQRHLRLRQLLTQLVVLLFLLPLASNSRWLQKARYGLLDAIHGQHSGIHLQPGDQELPRHSDLAIHAELLRWEQKAWIEYRESEDGELYRSPMTATPEGSMLFTFYDLASDVHYRVSTPALRSRWHRLSVFDPPRCLKLRLTTRPLPYTRRPVQEFDAFQDFKLVSGESFLLQARIPQGCQAELRSGEQGLPLIPKQDADKDSEDGDEGSVWELSQLVQDSAHFQLVLTDALGRQGREAPFTVTAEPDLPPIVELRQPTLDSQVKPGDAMRLELFAGDDFGLSRLSLHYSINGGERQQVLLRQAEEDATTEDDPPQLEWHYSELWDLPALELKDGDLLTCYVVASDNRQPNPQQGRTEIFFVVVRPEADSIDGEGQGQEQKADISDLLAEAKRLLRLSWDATQQIDAERERSERELLRDLKQLELDLRSRFHAMQEEAQGMMGEPFITLFNRASDELNEAAKMLERKLLDESIAPQERALAALTHIENEMLKNAVRSKKAQSGEDQGENEQDDQESTQNKQEQAQHDQAQQDKIDRLKKQREALQRLIGRQEEINRDGTRSDASAPALANKQALLHDDTGDLRRELQALSESKNAAAALHRAMREMKQGSQAYAEEDLRDGGIRGTRALAALVSALRTLEDALRNASANQIAQLAQRAEQLSQEQQSAAQASAEAAAQKPEAEAAKALREQQSELKQRSEELAQAIGRAADGLQDDYPEAAKALRSAAEQSRQHEISAQQQRAINALLYQRYERARKDQTDAANYLQALAMELQNAAAQLPPIGEHDLRDALQQLGEQSERVSQAMQDKNQPRASQRIEQARQDAADLLQRLADASKDGRLQQLSDELRLPTGESSPSAAGAESIARFRAAAAVLTQHLEKLLVERKLNIRRQLSPPPAKYQRLVEEYFKNLGRE